MSLLKAYIEGRLSLLLGQSPFSPAIKEKVYFITDLIDDIRLFTIGEETFPEKMSIKSFLNDTEKSNNEDKYGIGEEFRRIFSSTFSGKKPNFDTHINNLKAREYYMEKIFAIISEEAPECSKRIFNKITNKHSQTYNLEEELKRTISNIESIKLMAQPEYEPEQELNDLTKSLFDLLAHWLTYPLLKALLEHNETIMKSDFETIIENEAVLDLSLAKIAYQLGMKMEHILYYGRRERSRGPSVSQAKRARNAPPISKAFWNLKFPKEVFPKGVTIHKAATMIQGILWKAKRIDSPPDIKTITNYLKTDEKISELFKEKLVGKKRFHIMQVEDWENLTSA